MVVTKTGCRVPLDFGITGVLILCVRGQPVVDPGEPPCARPAKGPDSFVST